MNDEEIETLIKSRCCNILVHGCQCSGKRKLISKCLNLMDNSYSNTDFTTMEMNNKIYIYRSSSTLFEFDASLNTLNDIIVDLLEKFVCGEALMRQCNVIIYNVDHIKPTCLRKIIKLLDKHVRIFYVFTTSNLTRIDMSLISRVLCLGKKKVHHKNENLRKALNPLVDLLTCRKFDKDVIYSCRIECYSLLKNCFRFNDIAKELLFYFEYDYKIVELIQRIECEHNEGNKTIFYLEYMCINIIYILNNI